MICHGKELAFSRKEYLLIELFLRHPRRVFSRSDIIDHLWTLDSLPAEDTVKSHIRRIRRRPAPLEKILSKPFTGMAIGSIP